MNGIWILFEKFFLIVEINMKKNNESRSRIFMRDNEPRNNEKIYNLNVDFKKTE
jgi:hypothetical protein